MASSRVSRPLRLRVLKYPASASLVWLVSFFSPRQSVFFTIPFCTVGLNVFNRTSYFGVASHAASTFVICHDEFTDISNELESTSCYASLMTYALTIKVQL
jgi:hypothetical protein